MSDQRLLIVEDDEEIARLIFRVAVEEGFGACITHSNVSLVVDYERFQPQVIVLDILMPDVDGFEVLQFLGGRACTSRIIILSGQASYSQIAERLGRSLGLSVEEILLKPFRLTDLRQTLGRLKGSGALSEAILAKKMSVGALYDGDTYPDKMLRKS